MWSRSEYGRSRHTVPRKRSHTNIRSSRSSKSRVKAEEDEAPRKPDADELRKIRSAYFARPPAERRRIVPRKSTRILREEHPLPKAVKSSSSDEHRRRSSHRSTSDSSSRRSGRRETRSRNDDDFVYPVDPPAIEVIEEIPLPPVDRRRSTRSARSAPSRPQSDSSSSRRRRLPTLDLPDDEVTPDDSISQVAERTYQASRAQSHRSRQPTRERSRTTSKRLEPVVEVEYETPRSAYVYESRRASAPAAAPARKPSKRESSTIGSLFRRPSVNQTPVAPRLVDCLTCGADDVPSTRSAKLACDHRICHSCLKRVFEMSITDPAHMPPKCCTDKHIPLRHVETLFDLKFKVLWNRKYQEFHTKNRIYCPAPRCGEWIKPSHVHTYQGRKYASCPRCKTKVCTTCNNKMHRSRECPKDPEIARLIEQAKEKGWQRCFRCNSMVELKEGCNHMTCRCLAEFCMICGSKWKTCDCPWFNYSQLPDADRLNEMRVPEPLQALYRHVLAGAPGDERPAILRRPPPPLARDNGRQRTYLQEIDARRRQERLDEDLARRVQLASIMDDEDQPGPARRAQAQTWGLGNAAGHFMNDDYVRNATDVVMGAFGDAAFGQRGERAAGRRRRDRPPQPPGQDAGLAPNFLGDESVLGLRPVPGGWPERTFVR